MKFSEKTQKHTSINRNNTSKTFKITKTILVLFLTFTMSCSSDDDSPQITSPSVSYNTSTINATFFQNGNTNAPTVNWNGNQGTFSLANSINGLSIDANTGVVSWTTVLPAGEHEVQIVASNSAGQTTSYFTLKNLLQGLFIGLISQDLYFDVDFRMDGTVEIKSSNPPEPAFSGTWILTGDVIIANLFLIEDPVEQYSLKGNLVQTSTSATYSGSMYWGHNAHLGNDLYPFHVVLD